MTSPQDSSPTSEQPSPSPSTEVQAAPNSQPPARGSRRTGLIGGVILIALGAAYFGVSRHTAGKAGLGANLLTNGEDARGIERCSERCDECTATNVRSSLPAGTCLRSAVPSQWSLSDGSKLELGAESEARLLSDQRGVELRAGELRVELKPSKADFVVRMGDRTISATSADFKVQRSFQGLTLEVVRGALNVKDTGGRQLGVRAGERLSVDARGVSLTGSTGSQPLLIKDEPRLVTPERDVPAGIGQLFARKPGSRDERADVVQLTSHSVKVRIAGAVARTEIEETFSNTSDQVLEGIYRFPLPPEAQIERLALDVDGKFLDGAFVERSRAAAIWKGAIVNAAPQAKPLLGNDIVWVPGPWRDPALLEWQRGGRFELRIFPIPRHGSRRVALTYTERVPEHGEVRQYSYPLPTAGSARSTIARFDANVQVRGQDPARKVRVSGYAATQRDVDGGTEFSFSSNDFKPSGALGVEYSLSPPNATLRAWAYAPSGEASRTEEDRAPFVAIALKPVLPPAERAANRTLALVVDSSHSMLGESFQRATELAAELAKQSPYGSVLVFACNTNCRELGRASNAEQVRQTLAAVRPGGASDPTRALSLAYAAASAAQSGNVDLIYLGDGAPTVGAIRPAHIEAELQDLPLDRARVTTVGVGPESDTGTLRAIARGGGGAALRYVPGEAPARAASRVLTATSGRLLRNVSVSLPDGLYAAAPAQLDAIAAGSETWITARAGRAQIDGEVVLRGQLGTEPFEARYPLHLKADSSNASAFVPRLYAAERIADLEREGTDSAARAAAALSTRYHVASRYTSLLVLESEAMFTAFGLKRDFSAASWNAESVAEGEVALAEPEVLRSPAAAAKAGSGALGDAAGPAELEEKRFAAPPAAAPAAPRSLDASSGSERAKRRMEQPLEFEPPMRRPRPMIPMRKVWERVGQIRETGLTPSTATGNALAAAERLVQTEPDRREPVRKLYTLLARGGSLEAATRLVSSWLIRDPFDPDALTAHADLLARAGRREEAIEALGSVVDARPGDASALRRLERLLRWMGDAKLGCRYLVAAAELHTEDATLLADAVRCSRDTGNAKQEAQLWLAAAESVRERAEARLRQVRTDDAVLLGDLRVEASWEGDADIDLGIIDPDGLRASFLGAPTRAVISAREVTARDREGLALRGGKPGEYLIEVVRASPGSTSVRGTLRITAAGTTRTLPFTLYEQSRGVAVANIKMVSKLVPL